LPGAVGFFTALGRPFGLGGQVVRAHLDLLSRRDVIEVSSLNPPGLARQRLIFLNPKALAPYIDTSSES
jgi:hypothetical protein